jgi:hypothetical protein
VHSAKESREKIEEKTREKKNLARCINEKLLKKIDENRV